MIRWICIAALALTISACKSTKKVDDSATGDAAVTKSDGPDSVVDTPMSFDAQGSDSGKISGLETIHFDYDKAALSSATKKTLQGNADWMKNHAKVNIQIEGHCDARGSIEYNLSLGERRAKTVKDYMVSLGIAEKRISIISYGKEKPVASGDSESAMEKNRRANFVPLN